MNVETIYGGGHYILDNIRESVQTQVCFDIQILVPVVKDKEILHKLKIIHDLSVQALSFKGKVIKGADPLRSSSITTVDAKPIFFDDIKDALTGYARIIKYNNHSINPIIAEENMKDSSKNLINMESKNLEILEVEEGYYT